LLDFVVRHRGVIVARFTSSVDARSAGELQQVLADAVLRSGGDVEAVTEYEMDVHYAGEDELMMTFVASCRTA
jgi:hypothetical protein